MAGIYIHIPFCRQACHYCDFHFSTNLNKKTILVGTICKEIELQKSYLGSDNVETIYFGGGSPSLLSIVELDSVLSTIAKNFSLIHKPEITLEGNPDDLSYIYLKSLKEIGVNRLSIGIQSFDDKTLKFLNRVHSSSQSIQCLEDAQKAGFDNFSIDLIYGIPNPDHTVWKKDLQIALDVLPNHISAYCLTIEEKTAFGNWLKKGKLSPINDEFASEQYEMLIDSLENKGYEHYEVSNFSLPGHYSKHNSSYWKDIKYLGVGPGAHSYDGETRRFNVENNEKYLKFLAENQLPSRVEVLTLENKINEYILTTLRTSWGCDNDFLKEKYNFDLIEKNRVIVQKLIDEQYLNQTNQILTLTRKGRLFADKITEDLWVTF